MTNDHLTFLILGSYGFSFTILLMVIRVLSRVGKNEERTDAIRELLKGHEQRQIRTLDELKKDLRGTRDAMVNLATAVGALAKKN